MVRWSHVCGWLAIVFITASNASTPAAQFKPVGGVGITVFEDTNFRGGSATFREDIPDLRRFNLNDRISSLRVAPGEIWEACIDIEYGGRCVVFSGSESDLHRRSGWNDGISSLRRIRGSTGRVGRPPVGGPQIELYDRVNFRGRSRSLTGPEASLGSFGRTIQSVRVTSGRWEVCEGTRWGGRCVTINDNISDVSRLGLGGVSSVRPR